MADLLRNLAEGTGFFKQLLHQLQIMNKAGRSLVVREQSVALRFKSVKFLNLFHHILLAIQRTACHYHVCFLRQ